jgi:small-conductance mechanosensitive channel
LGKRRRGGRPAARSGNIGYDDVLAAARARRHSVQRMGTGVAAKDIHIADSWIAAFLPSLVGAAVLLLVFWVAARVVSKMMVGLGRRKGLDADLTNLLARATRLTLLVFGIITAIGTVGVDVKALVAGLGLTGFALGFAFKDIISNTLAGVLILLYKPFHRGDHIEMAITNGVVEGVVESIDMRYTTLKGTDGARGLVPNASLFTNPIKVRRP